jgi:2-polyprenyl-6-methoxyphenol hydroxylase-like FAD-dependent oxidoreductase
MPPGDSALVIRHHPGGVMREAIIVGGGIGGLCAALALRRAGVAATVYEAAPGPRTEGAALSLWPNAIRALDRLGVGAAVRALGVPDPYGGRIATPRGRTLAAASAESIAARFGAPVLVVGRAELGAALAAALPAGAIRYGLPLDAYSWHGAGPVIARFVGGERVRADLLVGADGLGSTVRRLLHPQVAPRYAGYTAWRAVVPFDHARVPLWGEVWGRGARFGLAPVGRDRVYYFATRDAPPGTDRASTPAGRHTELLRHFGTWVAPIPALLAATDPAAILQDDIMDLPSLPRWGAGPVTLLGDAAHAMTPNLGQGGCQAIEDAVQLGVCLREASGVSAALRAYEAARRPRTAWLQGLSRRAGWVGQWSHPLAVATRDLAITAVPAPLRLQLLAPILGYDVPGT